MNFNSFVWKFALYFPVKVIPALTGIFFILYFYASLPAESYVAYSICVASSLISAQLFAGWVGTSYIYYASNEKGSSLLTSCIFVSLLLAPVVSSISGFVSSSFIKEDYVFLCVWMLCFFQVIFFFLSAAFQAKYSVSTQLKSVGFQVVGQLLSVYLLFNIYAADFRLALIGLGIGYAGAVGYLFWAARLSFGVRYEVVGSALKSDFRKIFKYGYALMPWMLGALILTNIDRFSIGYYEIANGSAYLSLKDLFVGAGGLISMPLLMVVHSFIIDKFRQGSFGGKIIDGCLAYLILFFSICWCVLQFLGFEIFERFTGKVLLVPHYMLFMAFLCVFLNCASVYLQKRLEVHCRLRRLAIFSLASAVVGGLLVFLGGRYWGLLGVAIGSLIAHIIYFVLVLSTTIKKLDLMRFLWVPLLMSLFAFLSAYMIDKALRTGVFAEWWVIKAVWTILFTPVVFLAFWKGIQWKAVASEFTSR